MRPRLHTHTYTLTHRVSSPTEAEVAALHKTYTEALQKLWDDTVDKYGKGVKRPLAIVQ